MLLDYIRQVYASKKFIIGDTFEFVEFDEISADEITETEPELDAIEIWAAVKVPYKGELPESYKVLNLMIGDWVTKNEKALTKTIHEKLAEHFKANYPESDASELNTMEDSVIWLDQLDYMPRMDEEKKELTVEIELVVETEEIEEKNG
jgi:hypothetical protein